MPVSYPQLETGWLRLQFLSPDKNIETGHRLGLQYRQASLPSTARSVSIAVCSTNYTKGDSVSY